MTSDSFDSEELPSPKIPQPLPAQTRAERLASYSAKVRNLRVWLFATSIAVASSLPFILFATIGVAISSIGNSFEFKCPTTNVVCNDPIAVHPSSASEGPTNFLHITVITSWLLAVASVVLAWLLLREKSNSPGTKSAMPLLIVASAFALLLLVPAINSISGN